LNGVEECQVLVSYGCVGQRKRKEEKKGEKEVNGRSYLSSPRGIFSFCGSHRTRYIERLIATGRHLILLHILLVTCIKSCHPYCKHNQEWVFVRRGDGMVKGLFFLFFFSCCLLLHLSMLPAHTLTHTHTHTDSLKHNKKQRKQTAHARASYP
jgi:hypothetical protein